MSYMIFRALNTILKAAIYVDLEKHKTPYLSILTSYKYHNDNIIHIYSSKLLLDVSITPISMFHILPYKLSLRILLKILLPVIDLNILYKTFKTIINARNSDFWKIANQAPVFVQYILFESAIRPLLPHTYSPTIRLSTRATSTSDSPR